MKTSSPFCQCFLLLLCIVGIGMLSCNQPAKSTGPTGQKVLKNLSKDTLLNIVGQLAKTMQKRSHSIADGKKLLQAYATTYKINIGGAPNHTADSAEYLNVFVPDAGRANPEMVVFRMHPPQSLRTQITFDDLKKNYGAWIVSPPMEQATTITSMFNLTAAPDVSVSVDSEKMPGKKDNSIELITVMR